MSLSISQSLLYIPLCHNSIDLYFNNYPHLYYISQPMNCSCKRPLKYICSRRSCKQFLTFCDSPQCSHYVAHKSHSKFTIQDWLADELAINRQREQEENQTNSLINDLRKQLKLIKSNQFRLNKSAKFLLLMRKLRRDGANTNISHQLLDEIDQILQTRRQKANSDSRKMLNQILEGMKDMIKKCKQLVHSAMENDELIMEDIEENIEEKEVFDVQGPQKMPEERSQHSLSKNIILREQRSFQRNINSRQKSAMKFYPESNQRQFLTANDKKFITDSFTKEKVKSITKIYTGGAQQNKFRQSIFRQKCGHLKNTLIVALYAKQNVRTPNRNYFAGFTPLQIWSDHYREKEMQKDPSRLSRLFWFISDREQKRMFTLKSQTGDNALQVDERFGIGFGNDLIVNLRGGQRSKAINLGKHYECSPPLSQNEIKTIDNINEVVKGRTLEYQLYQIQFQTVKIEQRPKMDIDSD